MPSSPEPTIAAWLPGELTAGARPSPVTAVTDTFVAADLAPQAPPLFEIASSGGIPDDLLVAARSAARAAGYLEGWASGLRAAEARAAGETERRRRETQAFAAEQAALAARALAAVDAAAGALERRAVPGAAELEELIVSAALDIAEGLVGSALRDDDTRSHAALTRALALAPADEDVEIRLAPADHALVSTAGPLDSTRRRITLVADPTLLPGDAVAVSGATEVDARIAAGLARVRAVLQK
ncbi:MAG TPA: FliH/SctL family protein [Jatrophihabitans sp.]|jgi:flagellar assembly protein FliH|uniref:FliH/SctL family protein n=1 Tax=Jatrophihabitans sp. TaxID=1932789 RepID=UPI002E0AA219|nr:FliH/SctL family protein [Jatrophihabitans sp.]